MAKEKSYQVTSLRTANRRRILSGTWAKRIKKKPLKTKRTIIKHERREGLKRLGMAKLTSRRFKGR